MRRVTVTGAGGFIGCHLVRRLKREGYWVRGVDVKPPRFGASAADELQILDLRCAANALVATSDVEEVYALAADMGGMGFISQDEATILHSNALIDVNTIEACARQEVPRVLYASSACVYPVYLQELAHATPLRERDALPASPQGAYGWTKLFGEMALGFFARQYGIEARIARLHNVYGPEGHFDGGREKAPAAICRKVACAGPYGELEIWGDGRQTRSFCYVDDCVTALLALMRSQFSEPLNIGSERLVSIDELATIVLAIAERQDVTLKHVPGPEGVRGRCSDNRLTAEVLGWTPETSLETGMRRTYSWIARQLGVNAGGSSPAINAVAS
jgi:nucleoside-diphosphate-sugar epimerase